jgi:hypothetical protein
LGTLGQSLLDLAADLGAQVRTRPRSDDGVRFVRVTDHGLLHPRAEPLGELVGQRGWIERIDPRGS